MATNSRIRIDVIRLALAVPAAIAPLALSGAAAAQQPVPQVNQNQTLYIGVISGDDVYVRSGVSDSYYPFCKLNRGDFVKVTAERDGFARIALAGPAFKDAFGYIKYAKKDTARVRLAADGRSGVTLGRVDIIAPNMDANNLPKDSWKVLIRLEADKPITVVETIDSGEDVLYKVAFPAEATGWVSGQFVARATAEESEMFQNVLAEKTGAPTATPASTPNKPQDSAVAAGGNASTPPSNPPTTDHTAPVTSDAPPATTQAPELTAIAQTPATAPSTQPDKPKEPTFKDLETAFKRLQSEPVETAELTPMRDMYVALAERNPSDPRLQQYTALRIKQLDIWEQLQMKKQEIAGVKDRMKMSATEAESVRAALERSAEYAAVGRVASSTIYDGQSLPKLFRLQDPATGRTIAYLKPDTDYTLTNRIDIIVGIVGDKTYDEALRLNIITPRRIDVLSPEGKPAPAAAAAVPTDTVEDK